MSTLISLQSWAHLVAEQERPLKSFILASIVGVLVIFLSLKLITF